MMKSTLISVFLTVGAVLNLWAGNDEAATVDGVEIRMSVGIYGGGSCYFGEDGTVVYQRILPDQEAGHGMIEKRYVMMDSLATDWGGLIKSYNLIKILNSKRKTDVGVAGESTLTLKLYFSDGTVKERWAYTDDPITGVWVRMSEEAWSRADYNIPQLVPYEEKNFGNLRRYSKKSNKSEMATPRKSSN